MLVRQTPWLIPPRASATPQTDNSRIALTTQQISQIARIFDPPVEDELAKARIGLDEIPVNPQTRRSVRIPDGGFSNCWSLERAAPRQSEFASGAQCNQAP